ncbi:MAG: diguanylate cyclase [Coleofasciculaceae cyanobacterium SM2_3_26]|nr:diguanylate cyclase [Coleofasciculaceae cyanobacterium SM2_3_26]
MTIDEILEILSARQQKPLTELQALILRLSWEGKTYSTMALETHYGAEYLRKTASELWSMLSEIWGEPITKKNFREVLEFLSASRELTLSNSFSKETLPPIDLPGVPLPIDSPLYVPRPPIEDIACQEIAKPGCVVRIRAPRRMGKSSLMLRILHHAKTLGYQTVVLDLRQADEIAFTTLDRFLRWICANIARQLSLPINLEAYWDEEIGSKISCTVYLQMYILGQVDSPLVLAFNELNRAFEYPSIAREFLPLLRSWHEEAKQSAHMGKLRTIAVHSTEVYVPLKLHESPFNVGLPLELTEFTWGQVQTLALRYDLHRVLGNVDKLNVLMDLVGGHPYLVSMAFYHLRQGEVTVPQLLEAAADPKGIYSGHLRGLLATLWDYPELAVAMQRVVISTNPIPLDAIAAYKLESMGLIELVRGMAIPACNLYRQYFSEQLVQQCALSAPTEMRQAEASEEGRGGDFADRLYNLERENLNLLRLVNQDELTQLANRRFFDQQLEREWHILSGESASLAIIMCDIDHFKVYNDSFGHSSGDTCLRAIAETLKQVACRPRDVVARYGVEEFALLLPQTDAAGAVYIAERVRLTVRALNIEHSMVRIGGLPDGIVTLSLGVAAALPHAQIAPSALMAAADAALYESKRNGRDRVTPQQFR